MWDPSTALLAVSIVAGGALVLSPIARGVGGLCAIIGFFGLVAGSTWGSTVAALGVLAWLVGHWSFAVRNDARYRSRLARSIFDDTPLKWTLPQFHTQRKRNRQLATR